MPDVEYYSHVILFPGGHPRVGIYSPRTVVLLDVRIPQETSAAYHCGAGRASKGDTEEDGGEMPGCLQTHRHFSRKPIIRTVDVQVLGLGSTRLFQTKNTDPLEQDGTDELGCPTSFFSVSP